MSDDRIRIVLADDHAIVREGFTIIFNNQADMIVIGECSNGEEAVALVKSTKPDVIILDIQMPRMTGSAASLEILKLCPTAKILLLTTYDGDEDIYRAVHAGVRGYLLKESRKDEVLYAIREIAQGRRYLSPAVGATFASSVTLPQLTKREREILRLVSSGKPNKEIASLLNVTEGTVKGHVNGIMQKMNVASRTEAALIAERRGLLRD